MVKHWNVYTFKLQNTHIFEDKKVLMDCTQTAMHLWSKSWVEYSVNCPDLRSTTPDGALLLRLEWHWRLHLPRASCPAGRMRSSFFVHSLLISCWRSFKSTNWEIHLPLSLASFPLTFQLFFSTFCSSHFTHTFHHQISCFVSNVQEKGKTFY